MFHRKTCHTSSRQHFRNWPLRYQTKRATKRLQIATVTKGVKKSLICGVMKSLVDVRERRKSRLCTVLFGFYRYVCKDLKGYEKDLAGNHGTLGRDSLLQFKYWRKTEAVVERVVRTTADMFGPDGEQTGVRDKWEANCKSNGIKSIVGNYRHNRFNMSTPYFKLQQKYLFTASHSWKLLKLLKN